MGLGAPALEREGRLMHDWMMMADLKYVGTAALVSEMLIMSVKILVSWSAHSLSTRPGMSWSSSLVGVESVQGPPHIF